MRVIFFHLYYTFFQSHTYDLTTIILHDERGIYKITVKEFSQFYCYILSHKHLLIR
jgi:hypothetical protein